MEDAAHQAVGEDEEAHGVEVSRGVAEEADLPEEGEDLAGEPQGVVEDLAEVEVEEAFHAEGDGEEGDVVVSVGDFAVRNQNSHFVQIPTAVY